MMILIVEDEVLIGLGLHMVLSLAGHHVRGPAMTVASALAIAAEEKPDIALVDVNLAGHAEGLELARTLCEQHGTTIIFLTAQPDRARRARDIALGVITKPYDPQTPVRAVEVAAEARAGRQIARAPPGLELFT
jgi:DNA-binding response OmpR family regulator